MRKRLRLGYLLAALILGISAIRYDAMTASLHQTHKSTETRADSVTHVILLLGQSNMAGAAIDIDPVLDRGNPGILQYTATGSLQPATEPLSHQSGMTGGGPGLAFAREYLKTLPSRDTIALVPAAYSGVGFSTPDMGGGNLSWDVHRPDTSDNIYTKSLVQLHDALKAIKGKKQIDGVLVNVGGTDALNQVDPAAYQKNLDAFIAQYRKQLNDSDLPFVLGPSRSDIVASNSAYASINKVQKDTPSRVTNTAYINGSTGSEYYIEGDALHYNMRAHREMGSRYAKALRDLMY